MRKWAKLFATFFVCVLLVTSCVRLHMYSGQYTGQIPGTSNSYQMADGIYYPRGLTAIAVKIFYAEWSEEFKDRAGKVKEVINNQRVLWIHKEDGDFKDCNGNGLWGQADPAQNVIKIAVRAIDKSIAATSLVHELVHEANKAVNGQYDYDHTGDKYPGWTEEHESFIIRSNEKIRKAEVKFNKEIKALTKAVDQDKVRKKEEEKDELK